MSKRGERGKLAGWLVAEVLGVAALHRLAADPWLQVPWDNLGGWMQTAPPEDVVGATLRLVGLAVGYWLLAGTALYLLARLSRIPGAVRTVQWMTLPAVRRVVDQAVALSLATSIATGAGTTAAMAATPSDPGRPAAVVLQLSAPSTSAPPPTRPQPPQARPAATPSTAASSTTRPGSVVSSPQLDGAAPTSSPTSRRPSDRPPAPTADASEQAAARRYTVVAGDNLWDIAAREIAAATSRQPQDLSAAEIAPYWRQVIHANRQRLRSGDPDLIYPDEVLVLPPVQPGAQ
jgi:hypothetical protein